MVTLENGNMVIFGGYRNGQKVDMYDVQLEEWIQLPKLKMWSDRHDCILLDDSKVLIVDRYSRAEIYDVNRGRSETISGPKFHRGFAKLAKINGEIYKLGGDYKINAVEKFNYGKNFEVLPYKLLKGRSRFSCTTVTKSYIQSLGYKICQ